MGIVDSLAIIFVLSLATRYLRNLLDACGYVAGEISDARFEPEVQTKLRPGWAIPAWVAVLVSTIGFFGLLFVYGGIDEALGSFVAFALGYWVFDRLRVFVPPCDAPYFVRLLHRNLVARVNAENDGGRRGNLSNLVARIEAKLGGKLA